MAKHIIIAEDHPLFRTALRQTIEQIFGEVRITEADSIDVLQRIMEKGEQPDMILLDLNMPGAHGFSGLIFIHGYYPDCPVIVISAHEDKQTILQAVQYGASAYIPKSTRPEILKQALIQSTSGHFWFPDNINIATARETAPQSISTQIASLTPQQFRILGMVGEGLLNKQIAYELGIVEATVKAHMTAIFRKIGVQNRTQAVIAVQQLELDNGSNIQSGSAPAA